RIDAIQEAPARRRFALADKVASESRERLSPSRAPRTVTEPLSSYRSQQPAIGMQKPPVREEPWRFADHVGEPSSRRFRSLLLDPSRKASLHCLRALSGSRGFSAPL